MNKYDRINHIKSLHKKINPQWKGEPILLRGVSLENVCEFDGPGYRRVKNWYEQQIKKLIEIKNKKMYNKEKVEKATELLLEGLGLDLNDPNIKETPTRVGKMYEVILGGYDIDPKEYLKMFPSTSKDMVTLTNVPFYSFCSHHLLPFVGKLHIAYIPRDKVVGISKLVRFARIFAKRLNLQEDMTQNIADVLMEELNAEGVIVRVEASHMCMVIRGVRAQGSVMVTTAKRGVFEKDSNLLNEFNLAVRDHGTFSY